MKHYFWLDLEMTGLDEKVDKILEIAAVITNLDLQPVHSFRTVVFQPAVVLENMNDWCKKTHGQSGLTLEVQGGESLEQAEDKILKFADLAFSQNDKIVLAGNSIWNDRRFVDAQMTRFSKRLHYRMIDVSSFKEIFRSRYKIPFEKSNSHRAMEDIHESIRELNHYLSYVSLEKGSDSNE